MCFNGLLSHPRGYNISMRQWLWHSLPRKRQAHFCYCRCCVLISWLFMTAKADNNKYCPALLYSTKETSEGGKKSCAIQRRGIITSRKEQLSPPALLLECKWTSKFQEGGRSHSLLKIREGNNVMRVVLRKRTHFCERLFSRLFCVSSRRESPPRLS